EVYSELASSAKIYMERRETDGKVQVFSKEGRPDPDMVYDSSMIRALWHNLITRFGLEHHFVSKAYNIERLGSKKATFHHEDEIFSPEFNPMVRNLEDLE